MGIALNVPYSSDLVTTIVGLIVCFVVALDAVRRRSGLPTGAAGPVSARELLTRGWLRRDDARAPAEAQALPGQGAAEHPVPEQAGPAAGRRHGPGRGGAAVSHFFTAAVLSATIASGIALGAPLLLAALGETVGQRSGVLNLGVDGIMLLAAFGAYLVALRTGSIGWGVLVALAIGAVMGLITAFINVTIGAEQGISGIGIYIAALGLSGLLFERYVGTPKPIANSRGPFPAVHIPLLDRIPYLGTMLFKQNILVYAALLLVPALTYVLHHTTYGMNVQAAGENPAAADSLGVSVTRVRYTAVIFGSTMAGLAGASLLILDGIFQENLTQGAGFIAVALVYFGGWRQAGVAVGALIQKLIMARELSRSPAVLLVAQPTRGIDVASSRYIHQRLLGQRDAGAAVVVISEDLDEVMTICDRLLVVYEGRIAGEADPRTVSREAIGLLMAGTTAGSARHSG